MRKLVVKLPRIKINLPSSPSQMMTKGANKYYWKDKELLALIKAVKKHPEIYMNNQRNVGDLQEIWDKVLAEIGSPKLNARQAKSKWLSLVKKSKRNVMYKFNKFMKFLPEANEITFNGQGNPQHGQNSGLDSQVTKGSPNYRMDSTKRQCIQSPELSSTRSAIQVEYANTAFCKRVLTDLNTLTDAEALQLRRSLMERTCDFASRL